MIAVNRRTRSACALLGLVAILLGVSVTTATAAPSFSMSLSSDASDVQAVYVEGTIGQFRLEFGSGGLGVSETGNIPATASAEEVQSALNALSNISNGGGSVSVRIGTGDSNGVDPYLVSFDGGPLKNTLQPLLTAKDGTEPLGVSPLGGGPPIAYVATRAPGGIARSDERINYLVDAKNTAPAVAGNPVAGATLGCSGAKPNKNWTPATVANRPSAFAFEWRRNGAVIAGEGDPVYVTAPVDEGAVLQCIVKGTSADGKTAAKYASLPGAVVDPQPATAPPAATTPTAASSRPTIAGASPRTCTAPTGVSGSPTWTFQWLRNGNKIAGANTNATATTSEYTPVEADQGTRLQCESIATNAGGSLVSISEGVSIGAVVSPPVLSVAQTPTIIVDATSPIVELELPAGSQTHFFDVVSSSVPASNYWGCIEEPAVGPEPANVVCTTPNVLAPQAQLSSGLGSLTLGIALGGDAPELASFNGSVSGAGASTATSADSFSIGPERLFGLIPGRFSARALTADGEDHTQAGGHPVMANSSLSFNRDRRLVDESNPTFKHRPVANLRNVKADIPPGFIGNPQAVPELCPRTQDMVTEPTSCPPASIVGELALQMPGLGTPSGVTYKRMPLYAMTPERGVPAQFATAEPLLKSVYVLTPRLRPEDGYAISIDSLGIVENPPILDVRVTLCGYGANSRLAGSTTLFASCKLKGDPGAYAKPFLTSQTECASDGPVTTVHVDSWKEHGDYRTVQAVSPKMTGCDLVPFEPKLDLKPTANDAESASGLDVQLTVPSDGLEDPDGIAQAHLKKTMVTLPKGMSLNPSAADGLAACTQAEVGMVNGVPNNDPVKCPDASKIGTAVVHTPILEEPLEGGIYLAKQGDHPFPGDIAAIYVVAESKERGVLIKLPGRVEIRPGGQIVSTFDDNPQAPFSSLELSFNSGPRAALMTPQRCGSYEIVSQLTPWSAADPDNPTPAETVTQTSKFDVTSGPGGGACPTGAMAPKLNAGITNTIAGESSPFVLSLSRGEGTQRFNGLTMSLPPGLSANLSGVPYCSDATLASIPTALGTGQAEINRPSCPAASRVGSVSVGAGAGNPYYVSTGSAYLAGPYKGAPLSLAVVIPAVAGPFDLGNVVVRNAAFVDPRTAQVSIKSDPLPTQVHNLPVDVRDVRVTIDRPGFMRAPTNCQEMRIDAVVSGEEGGSAPLSNRFQVGECGSLDFGPKLKLEYKGQTKRTGNPALRAVLTQPAGQANIANTQVILPKGSFIDNAHINNPCTRAQYAANACPAKSILGKATAWSPLLDEPLSGNVYFRSNGGERELPDIVAKLQGQVEVELVGYVDSVVNKKTGTSRVRNTFAIVPDAPVSRFVLTMKGGKLGLIENSKNLCKQKNRATVKMNAHNGLALTTEPVVKTSCGKKAKKRKK